MKILGVTILSPEQFAEQIKEIQNQLPPKESCADWDKNDPRFQGEIGRWGGNLISFKSLTIRESIKKEWDW